MPVKIISSTPKTSPFETFSDSHRRVNAKSPSFASELMDQQDDGLSREQMEELLKQIDEQAAKLSKTPTYDELKAYRTLIKNFVGAAVSQMYELHTQAGWDRMGRQRVYTTVRKIDNKLEEMAEKIRLGHSEQLDVIASHDAIRGMLVDLYM
ncbi:MAG: YaaR family protein [Selenomonadaceae bacterium]|nr:YaaR family protein [Selenomonadaceae bacterium]MBR1859311.1 YaaR family protein [Selenomonadaceae bacterium]